MDASGAWRYWWHMGSDADDAPPMDIVGEADNCGLVREVLRRPFHGHYKGDVWKPSHVHHIQYCCGCGNTPLIYSGDGWGSIPEGIFQGSTDPICFVLRGWQVAGFPNSRQAPGVTRHSDGLQKVTHHTEMISQLMQQNLVVEGP